MGRDRTGYQYNYEPAREPGITPSSMRKAYDGPISYGGGSEERPGITPPPPPLQPTGYYAAQPALASPYSPYGAVPHQLTIPAMPMPSMMPSPGGWYAAPPNPVAAFAPYGAKPGGVKTTTADDRPPALMVNPTIAADKATVHIQMQVRWDLRTKPTAEHMSSNGGMPPDLSQPATNPPTRAMYIVAEELPWAITIKRYNIITCQDVLDSIYKTLQEPIKRDEYFAANAKKRAQITKIAIEEAEDPDSGREVVYNESGDTSRPADPLRIDWLDALTDFRGLYIDEKILNERCTWQIDDLQDAWVMDIGLNHDE